eukprot:1157555-Pelagomonas_calceolata.AAC.1
MSAHHQPHQYQQHLDCARCRQRPAHPCSRWGRDLRCCVRRWHARPAMTLMLLLLLCVAADVEPHERWLRRRARERRAESRGTQTPATETQTHFWQERHWRSFGCCWCWGWTPRLASSQRYCRHVLQRCRQQREPCPH